MRGGGRDHTADDQQVAEQDADDTPTPQAPTATAPPATGPQRHAGRVREFLNAYGLGILLAGNIFGAGSVYILSNAGLTFGLALGWVVALSIVVGMVFHEQSATLAASDRPIFSAVRDRVGQPAATGLAVSLGGLASLWGVANYAIAGLAARHALSTVGVTIPNVSMAWFALTTAVVATGLVATHYYAGIERYVSGALGVLGFGLTVAATAALTAPSATSILATAVPAASTIGSAGYWATAIGLLGTTVYWPNFVIQASMHHDRYAGWSRERIRRENLGCLVAAVGMSLAFLTVAAIVLPTVTSVEAGLSVATPLNAVASGTGLGTVGFGLGALVLGLAAFTSATGTLFCAGFMVPNARGHQTRFGDRAFSTTVAAYILLSAAAVPIVATHFTPVEMAVTMPALNGLIGLPIVYALMWWATTDADPMHQPSRAIHVVYALGFLLTLGFAVKTAIPLLASIGIL